MKAIIKETTGTGTKLVTIDIPRVGRGEVLVKLKAALFCGTDFHAYSCGK